MSNNNNRRQTLANLSPGALNARAGSATGGNGAAAGAGRVSKDAPGGLPAKGRKSLAPGLAVERPSAVGLDVRRSSAFGGKPSGPKQDPRPLNNKDYLNNCIRTVITYLSTHSFPAAVSPKTLASPTGKDFATVVQFLFQQFDPTFRIQSKVEDEVPAFFKRLNYPFQISKSALFAVGSPHSWPAVLAALTWLVELLNYIEKADESSGPTFERDNKVRGLRAPGACRMGMHARTWAPLHACDMLMHVGMQCGHRHKGTACTQAEPTVQGSPAGTCNEPPRRRCKQPPAASSPHPSPPPNPTRWHA